MRLKFAFLFLALAAGSAGAEQINVNGVARTYILDRATTTKPGPVIIGLHGGGGSAAAFKQDTGLSPLANAAGVAVVYPETSSKQWNDGRIVRKRLFHRAPADDMGFLQALVNDLVAKGIADPNRVIFTGISNGGMMSFAMACKSSIPIYAVVPISANLPVGLDCDRAKTRLINIVGTADRVVPMQGGPVLGGLEQGAVQSSQETFNEFLKSGGCNGTAKSDLPNVANDGMTSVSVSGVGCKLSPIRQIIVQGGGHAWAGGAAHLKTTTGSPTQDFSASQIVVQLATGKL